MYYVNCIFADSSPEAFLYVFWGSSSKTDVYRVIQGKISWINITLEMIPFFKFQGYTTKGSDILMVGGQKRTNEGYRDANNCVIKYNTKNKAFKSLLKFIFSRRVPTVFTLNSHLYVTGSRKNHLKEGDLNMYKLDLINKTATWQISNVTLPFPIAFTHAVVINNRVYICSSGGNSNRWRTFGTKHRTSVIMWKQGMTAWKSLPDLNIPRQHHCTVTGEGLG